MIFYKMLKYSHIFLTSTLVLFLVDTSIAQTYPDCFMINSLVKVINLSALCNMKNEGASGRNVISTQELYEQADALFRKGFYKEAATDMTRVIDRNPNDPTAYLARANARTQMGDMQEAFDDLQKSIDIYRATGRSEIADLILKRLQRLQGNTPQKMIVRFG